MDEHSVKVYIYDLSRGMARTMSAMLIGKQLDGIWHTGIVAYGQEWFFGGMGIESCPPAGTIMGQPDQIEDVGTTQIPFELFMQHLQELAQSTFRPECYHLFDHNCNTFSNEIAMFLTGTGIPSHITALPQEVLNTPFGQMIKPMLDSMQVTPQGGHRPFQQGNNSSVTAAAGNTAASRGTAGIQSPSVERQEPSVAALPKDLKLPTFSNDKAVDEYNSSKAEIHAKCDGDIIKLLDEFCEYLSTKEATWSPSPKHISCFDSVIKNSELSDELKGAALGLLQEAALKEDVVVLVVNDPQQHGVKWLQNIDKKTIRVQERVLKIACNCCSKSEGRNWMLLNKDWKLNGEITSNRKLLSKCIMLSVLSDQTGVQEGGGALAESITALKVDEDTVLEIGSALIEALANSELSVSAAEYCLHGLENCMSHNKEVADLASVMGLDVNKYSSKSAVCEKSVKSINAKYLTATNN